MKNRVLFLFLISSIGLTAGLQAQNRTLGVGATTPNENAALHVESPTNNQGFIMPRLTTVQRTAMTLDADDIGLMVYDRDLQEIVTWNGTAWTAASTFLSSDTTATLRVINNGTIAPSDVAGSAAILAETTNAFSAITGRIPASASGANAITGITRSTNPGSWAGYFDALTGTAVWGSTNSDVGGALAPVGVYGESRGTGSVGGAFWIQNAENSYPALYSNTIGTGPSLSANISNPANNAPVIFAETNGNGSAAHFRKLGTTGGNAVLIESEGGGALFANNNGATGYAAVLQNINTENTSSAIFAEAVGPGPSVWVMKSTDAVSGDALLVENVIPTGAAARFQITDGTNPDNTISVTSAGTGTPAHFEITNSGSGAAAVFATTNGTGAAFQAVTSTGFTSVYGRREGTAPGNAGLFDITDAANPYPALQANTVGDGNALNAQHTGANGDAIYAEKTGTAGGAGNFRISNIANTTSALHGSTTAPGGAGVSAANEANGIAFSIINGGMRVRTMTLTGGGNITQRAVAYQITDAGSYTFDTGAVPLNEGDIFYFYNTYDSAVTVDGIQIPPAPLAGKTLIYLGGALREF